MIQEENKCKNCSIRSSTLSVLSHHELSILDEACSKIQFRKGELIFKEGSPARFVTYIRDGYVKITKKGISGRDYILNISKEGDYLGLLNLNNSKDITFYSAYALTDTQVCFLDIDKFGFLLENNGGFAKEVITCIIDNEVNYFNRFLNNVQQQLPGRLANAILYFYQQVYKKNPFAINLTKSELASLIGTSRESVTRMLKSFQNDGIIEMTRNDIFIIDEIKLEEIKKKG